MNRNLLTVVINQIRNVAVMLNEAAEELHDAMDSMDERISYKPNNGELELARYNKMEAIKAYKAHTGETLIECKRAIEAYMGERHKIYSEYEMEQVKLRMEGLRKRIQEHETVHQFIRKHWCISQRPKIWEELTGIRILDPDGWRRDKLPIDKRIQLHDFLERALVSTVDLSRD